MKQLVRRQLAAASLLAWLAAGAATAQQPAGAVAAPQLPALPLGPLARSLDAPLLKSVRRAENFEPVIVHEAQSRAAAAKLAELRKRFGRAPNVLVLLVDDLGLGDVGAYGGGEAIGAPTPHIDRLAREGLKLTATYAQPTCTPTRAAMLTGRLPVRSGLVIPPLGGSKASSGQEVFSAKVLSEAGYRTALSGKWHLGEVPGSRPTEVGFDEFLGFLTVINTYQDWRDPASSPQAAYDPEVQDAMRRASFSKNLVRGRKGEPLQDLEEITMEVSANVDQKFADFSEDFIRRSVKDGKPFYLVHAFSKVHFINVPSTRYRGRSPAKDPYHDSLVEVDDIVGRLASLLEQLGVAGNTLVFFTSDNGPEEDAWPDSGHTPFRGAKGTTLEGGVRVPGIAWWPGTIRAGRASDGLFDLMDLFNTSLALAGVDAPRVLPADRFYDGVDQTSFLLADDGESAREAVYLYNETQFAGMRWRNWKVRFLVEQVDGGTDRGMGGLNDTVILRPNIPWFHNLYTDPKERRSVTVPTAWPLAYGMSPLLQVHGLTMRRYPPRSVGLQAR